MSAFEERLAVEQLPPPGQDHFAARRALWLSPGLSPPSTDDANPSRQKLEALLRPPGAHEDDGIWEAGLNRIWRGLVGSERLRHRLPLALVVSSDAVLLAPSYPGVSFVPSDKNSPSGLDTRRHMASGRTPTGLG